MKQPYRSTDIVRHKTGCWSFRGRPLNQYVRFSTGNYLHRLSLEFDLGWRLRSRQFVCHRCDNPGCFNPRHLFVGSQKDNMRDCRNKGRHAHGETSYAKLTEDDVRRIRRTFVPGVTLITNVAKKYAVSSQAINNLLRGKSWAHIREGIITGSLVRRGESSVVSKLRLFQVCRARRLAFGLGYSVSSIARSFGVHHSTLYDAVHRRKTWKKVQ